MKCTKVEPMKAKEFKPMKVLVKFIGWDVSTSIRLTLPNQIECTLPYLELKEWKVFTDDCGWAVDGTNEHNLGDYILTKLAGKYGYAIKQIKYEILDYGDCPRLIPSK